MVVCAVCDHLVAVGHQLLADGNSIGAHLLLVLLELRGACMLEGHCQSSNLVVVRATLEGWEDGEVDLVLKVVAHALALTLAHASCRLDTLHVQITTHPVVSLVGE